MLIFDKYYKIDPHKFIDTLGKKFKFRGLDDKHVQGQYFLCCPFHSNGQERTASANFSLVDKGRTREGDFYCFGCKTSGHISSILVKLFGDKTLAQRWVEGLFGNKQYEVEEEREVFKIKIEQEENEAEPQIFELREDAYLEETVYYGKRGIPDELVKRFKLGFIDNADPEKRRVYIPVFNNQGQVIFYMTRNLHNKSFYLPKDAKKFIWGANEIKEGWVCICESVFNALTLYKYGRQAVALFGTGDEREYEQLLELPNRGFILCLDNDTAGQKGTKALTKFLKKNNRLVQTVFINEPGKDLNDFAHLTQEEFDEKWESWLRR